MCGWVFVVVFVVVGGGGDDDDGGDIFCGRTTVACLVNCVVVASVSTKFLMTH